MLGGGTTGVPTSSLSIVWQDSNKTEPGQLRVIELLTKARKKSAIRWDAEDDDVKFTPGLSNWLEGCCTLGLLVGSLQAQVTIQNPQRLEVPEKRVQVLHNQVLHNIVCRVVAEEFHIRKSKVQGPMTLVLGENQGRTVANEFNGVYSVYLEHWDETTFVSSDVRLAIQRMAFRNHSEQMAREVIRRADHMIPVAADTLRTASSSNPKPTDNCAAEIHNSEGNDVPCGQSPGRANRKRQE